MKKPLPVLSAHGILWSPTIWDGGAAIWDGSPTAWKAFKQVAQLTARGHGNAGRVGIRDQQIRAHVIPLDPKTPAQLARRGTFRTAMQNWALLTQTQKQAYNTQAKPLKISGVNLFIRNQTS